MLMINSYESLDFKLDLSIFLRSDLKLSSLGRTFKTKSRFKSFLKKNFLKKAGFSLKLQ